MARRTPPTKQVPLTKKRQRYVDQFKPTAVMRGKPLNYNAGVQAAYTRNLEKLVQTMTKQVRKELEAFFKTETAKSFLRAAQDGKIERRARPRGGRPVAGMDATVSSQARILTNALTKKFNQLFAQNAKPMAEGMANNASKASKSSLHASLEELTGGLSLKTSVLNGPLYEIIDATVTENVALIKSISQEYLHGVQSAVMRSITNGEGLKTLVPYLEQQEGVTRRRAQNIAIDQTRKAYNNINRGRMEAIGLKQYEWLHTGGSQKPRPLHLELSGQIFSFDDPPVIDDKTGERGIPGQLINCGCRMRPVINFEKGRATNGARVNTDNPEDDDAA